MRSVRSSAASPVWRQTSGRMRAIHARPSVVSADLPFRSLSTRPPDRPRASNRSRRPPSRTSMVRYPPSSTLATSTSLSLGTIRPLARRSNCRVASDHDERHCEPPNQLRTWSPIVPQPSGGAGGAGGAGGTGGAPVDLGGGGAGGAGGAGIAGGAGGAIRGPRSRGRGRRWWCRTPGGTEQPGSQRARGPPVAPEERRRAGGAAVPVARAARVVRVAPPRLAATPSPSTRAPPAYRPSRR